MATARNVESGRKKASLSATKTKKASSVHAAIKPGSFLAKGGGMVPTVRLGKRASKKAI